MSLLRTSLPKRGLMFPWRSKTLGHPTTNTRSKASAPKKVSAGLRSRLSRPASVPARRKEASPSIGYLRGRTEAGFTSCLCETNEARSQNSRNERGGRPNCLGTPMGHRLTLAAQTESVSHGSKDVHFRFLVDNSKCIRGGTILGKRGELRGASISFSRRSLCHAREWALRLMEATKPCWARTWLQRFLPRRRSFLCSPFRFAAGWRGSALRLGKEELWPHLIPLPNDSEKPARDDKESL